jgi:hydrogenase maturation protein HypF
VFLEVEGTATDLETFLLRLQNEKPVSSFIQSMEFSYLDPIHFTGFEIRSSIKEGMQSALILPDIATCSECLSEVLDPANRRYRYPFTNCTNCGPRFSIIESLPYDRPNTSMKSFEMCTECREEYEDPQNRRFHAQPNACPACGPKLSLWNSAGEALLSGDEALLATASAVQAGKVVALKGLGGFLLLADAGNAQAIETLRVRKHREEKPFALMYPSIESIWADCEVSPLEARLMTSPESPIVLLKRKPDRGNLAPNLAPANPYLGAMLPYTPLHHLLMKAIGSPVIATSGNLSDEPICIDEREALTRLAGIADLFLVHNRPIVRHVDDSIVRIILGRELVLRRARGYAPLPIRCTNIASGVLAVGGHLKNTIALSVQNNVFISQHIGDLENKEASEAFERVIAAFQNLYKIDPVQIAADMHPDYCSSKFARETGKPVIPIQHHFAHVAACMAENELNGPVLGVAWDGTGYGLDGTVWGGEFLLTNERSFTRVATFRKFRLPGSVPAVREPRRTALGALYEIFGDKVFELRTLPPVQAFTSSELSVIAQMLRKGINSPYTSSAGRLFDAVASITGLRQIVNFEGQAAMELEFAIGADETDEAYPYAISDQDRDSSSAIQPGMIVDWESLIHGILKDVHDTIPLARIARKFHNSLAEIIVNIAKRIAQERVVLTGGCFQNKHLIEITVKKLEDEGFRPYWHQRIPPNDGGIALGQIVAASRCGSGSHDAR